MNRTTRYLAAIIAGMALLVASCAAENDEAAPTADVPDAPPLDPAMLDADKIVTDAGGELAVKALHHATFVLTWNGKTVYVDPAGAPGGPEGSAAADFAGLPPPNLVLVTDVHGDHLSVPTLTDVAKGNAVIVAPPAIVNELPAELKARARPLANGETTTVEDLQIEAIPMYNTSVDRLQYHEKGRGNGYVLTMGGKRIYIAGDTEDIPEMRALQNIDVAFVPMNLPYTMTPQQAADAVLAFKPKLVYPYHHGESDVGAFATLVAANPAIEVRRLNWYP